MVVALRYIFATLLYCVCVLSCIDTHHFVYTSLSQSLYPSIIGLLTVVGFMLVCLFKKKIPDFDKIQILALILVAYIFLHGMIKDAEIYKQGYTISTLLFMVALAGIMKVGILSKQNVENGIILISVINIVYLVAQYLNFIDSGNSFFPLTGANENPNTAAIALTIGIPFIIKKMVERKHVYVMSMLLLLSIVFILTLKCRTALNGLACIIICYSLSLPKVKLFIKTRIKNKTVMLLLTGMVLALFYISYNWKKDSADGRLFIWQRNCEMIANSPLGNGYGKYEVEYNLYQSQYFASHKEEYVKSTLTTASGSAYNDFIEHSVQGGILGGFLILLFLLLSVYQAYYDRNWYYAIALSSVTIMSLSDIISYSISPWIMTIMIIALVANSAKEQQIKIEVRLICTFVFILMSLLILYRDKQLVVSQKALKECQDNGCQDMNVISDLFPAIGTSEAYWRYRAECNENIDNYKAADSCYSEVRKFTSAPLILFKSAVCKEKLGDKVSALQIMNTAVCMLPRNFSLKYHLMLMYSRMNDMYHARLIAQEIATTPEKIHNETVHFIKEEAEKMLGKRENTIHDRSE